MIRMPDINDHQREQFYDDDALTAVQRLRDAVRREAQAIQDELDTEGDLQEDANS
jgi:hypothetical protein